MEFVGYIKTHTLSQSVSEWKKSKQQKVNGDFSVSKLIQLDWIFACEWGTHGNTIYGQYYNRYYFWLTWASF